ncbi:MAG: glycosyltransferase family 4 protein [Anaerolineae bacterium]
MKIGLIVPGFSAHEQDWCIPALLNLARVLATRHDVHILTLRYPHERRTYNIYGASVYALGGGTRSGVFRLPLMARALRILREAHQRAPFDVLHGLWADEPGWIATRAGSVLGVPAVVSLMGGELVQLDEVAYGHQQSMAARYMIQRSLENAQAVTVGSEEYYNHVRETVGQDKLPPESLWVTPLGVDTALFSPEAPSRPGLLRGDYKLLHVASLVPVKNQAMLLAAFAQVQARIPGAVLHIIGEGVLRAELEQQVQALHIAEAVVFHGAVAHDALPDYYRAADVCVLTSYYESQSMVALEAAACGRATLGTPVGILPELLPEAWLTRDPAGLAENLIALHEEPELRDMLAEVMTQHVLDSLTLEQSTATFEALYRHLISPGP